MKAKKLLVAVVAAAFVSVTCAGCGLFNKGAESAEPEGSSTGNVVIWDVEDSEQQSGEQSNGSVSGDQQGGNGSGDSASSDGSISEPSTGNGSGNSNGSGSGNSSNAGSNNGGDAGNGSGNAGSGDAGNGGSTGGSTSNEGTYEWYESLSAADQQKYFESFDDPQDFFAWYNDAKADYEDRKEGVEVDGPSVDLGDYID